MDNGTYVLDGPRGLGDHELLTYLVGHAGTAAGLLDHFGGLAGIALADPAELVTYGLETPVAVRVHAAMVAGRRSLRPRDGAAVVRSSSQAFAVLGPALQGLDVEEFHALYLDRGGNAVCRRELTRGTAQYTVIDPATVFRPALGCGASQVVVAHNHPSGNPDPSPQDLDITRRLVQAGRVLGVAVVDHLIITHTGFTSLAERGLLGERAPPGGSTVVCEPTGRATRR